MYKICTTTRQLLQNHADIQREFREWFVLPIQSSAITPKSSSTSSMFVIGNIHTSNAMQSKKSTKSHVRWAKTFQPDMLLYQKHLHTCGMRRIHLRHSDSSWSGQTVHVLWQVWHVEFVVKMQVTSAVGSHTGHSWPVNTGLKIPQC